MKVVDQEKMEKYIDSLIEKTDSFFPAWNNEGFKGKWNYIDGVFLNSVVNMYKDSLKGNKEKALKYKEFFIRYINYYIEENGNFNAFEEIAEKTYKIDKENNMGYKGNELDSVCASKILFDAYEMTNDDRYLKAINHTYDSLIKMSKADNINFSHKESYKGQVWLDGMYMYVPFYARYAILNNKPEIFDEITLQYKNIRHHMFDEEKKLYYHGYDSNKEIFWCDKATGCSESFWLRSTGWFLVSIVDVLEYFSEGDDKNYLISLLNEAVEGIMQYQDKKSKLFYQLIDKKDLEVLVPSSYLRGLKNSKYFNGEEYVDSLISNYLETSGSSMISYTLMKGAKSGYLDKKYEKIGKEIFEEIFKTKLVVTETDFNLHDICITAGLGPVNNTVRDGSIYYYLAEPVGENDAKGVGPFIMSYIEYLE